jgi:hypothetical protein
MTLRLNWIRTLTFSRSLFFVVNNSIYGSLFHIWRKTWKQILKNADFKKITKIVKVTVHNFSTFWALFWDFEHFLAIFASTSLGFYQRNRESPNNCPWLISPPPPQYKIASYGSEILFIHPNIWKFENVEILQISRRINNTCRLIKWEYKPLHFKARRGLETLYMYRQATFLSTRTSDFREGTGIKTTYSMMFVMLLWVCIHTGQADWKVLKFASLKCNAYTVVPR